MEYKIVFTLRDKQKFVSSETFNDIKTAENFIGSIRTDFEYTESVKSTEIIQIGQPLI